MANRITLKIYDLIGPIWVSTDDGQKVFDKIVAAFEAGRAVDLSFAHHENLISSFLNAAIGQLYSSYSEDFLAQHLAFADLDDDDRIMLDRTIDNAKRYFANPDAYDQAWEDEIGKEIDEEFDEE
ncbi:MAG: STAS-like domain-containing protein [Azoarcus sp.]|jgi:hypothetical protein|nr:STAS-like domain-containing protein [Azoarcus sp.]